MPAQWVRARAVQLSGTADMLNSYRMTAELAEAAPLVCIAVLMSL